MRICICCLFIASGLANTTYSQNVGIGTNEPMNRLQIHGNLLVTTPTIATNTGPTAAQIKTIITAGTISFSGSDSTGRIYDPGGPTGNYNANQFGSVNISGATSAIGTEITAEAIGLGPGDSLIIKETSSSDNYLLAVGNGYTTTGKWIFNSADLYIIFKSNIDANTGIGFSLLFKRLYNNSASLPDMSGETGSSLLFDTKTGSFRSGNINNANRGENSTAMGSLTIASGKSSIAMGEYTTATGPAATAMGFLTNSVGNSSTALGLQTTASGVAAISMGFSTGASGNSSTAMGNSTTASGEYSTAMGVSTTASGDYSTAMGYNTVASGNKSTAMGNNVSTNNQHGCFVIGDNSITTIMNSPAPNNFRARFDNGYRLYTSADYSTSCSLGAGDNAWTTTSDMRLKENFETVNGEDFLKKIATMRLVSWNYKKQDPSKFRHYGPMAQDFYAAFGKDKHGNIGNDTTINQADFDGVNLIAIQALEKRTQKIERLEKENAEMKAMLLSMQKELDKIKVAKK